MLSVSGAWVSVKEKNGNVSTSIEITFQCWNTDNDAAYRGMNNVILDGMISTKETSKIE